MNTLTHIQKHTLTHPGLAFSELYMKSRESFLVNSEPTLRAQLVEFTDHHLIKLKKVNNNYNNNHKNNINNYQ